MGTLTCNVRAATELIAMQGQALDQPLFQTLSPAQFSESCLSKKALVRFLSHLNYIIHFEHFVSGPC